MMHCFNVQICNWRYTQKESQTNDNKSGKEIDGMSQRKEEYLRMGETKKGGESGIQSHLDVGEIGKNMEMDRVRETEEGFIGKGSRL